MKDNATMLWDIVSQINKISKGFYNGETSIDFCEPWTLFPLDRMVYPCELVDMIVEPIIGCVLKREDPPVEDVIKVQEGLVEFSRLYSVNFKKPLKDIAKYIENRKKESA